MPKATSRTTMPQMTFSALGDPEDLGGEVVVAFDEVRDPDVTVALDVSEVGRGWAVIGSTNAWHRLHHIFPS